VSAGDKYAFEMQGATLEFAPGVGVFDLNMHIPGGTIVGMIGPSGCGKSTTVRLLLGLYKPTAGSVHTMGKVPSEFRPVDRERIGYIPQQFVLYPNLSVAENIDFVSALYGMPAVRRRERLDELLEFVEMSEAKHRLGRQLSGGMQRRLMLASALMHDPALLFADEPTAGIDPVLRDRFWEQFRKLRDEGRTLFVTTQIVSEAVYCDYVAVMRKGRLLAIDTPQNLRHSALGGEFVDVVVDAARAGPAMKLLRRCAFVIKRENSRGKLEKSIELLDDESDETDTLRILVDSASERLPEVLNLLENEGMTIHGAGEHIPSYDEVFIRIMEEFEYPAQPTGAKP
jgi:ABC-2 type transport system ATP-binding protein